MTLVVISLVIDTTVEDLGSLKSKDFWMPAMAITVSILGKVLRSWDTCSRRLEMSETFIR